MRWRPEFFCLALIFAFLTSAPLAVRAAPPVAPKAAPLPDFGGRESPSAIVPASVPDTLPSLNPAAQVGRALGALALVLALVFGVLSALKRLGIASVGGVPRSGSRPVKPPKSLKLPKSLSPPDSPLLLLGSQPLPGTPGAVVHLLTIADRTLVLGATAQQVTVLAELEPRARAEKEAQENSDDDERDGAAFEAYLQRQDIISPTTLALVIQTARTRVGQAADRLSALSTARAERNGTD